jgi:Leucine-rich repeat (LRR) protein
MAFPCPALRLTETGAADLTPLEALVKLKTLDLEKTKVKNLAPLYKLTSLVELNLRYVSVPASEVKALKKALPQLKITR